MAETDTPSPRAPKLWVFRSPGLPPWVTRDVTTLLEGEAGLYLPATLSPASVQDIEDWLALVLNRLKRRCESHPTVDAVDPVSRDTTG
jgi:hypothetical protein